MYYGRKRSFELNKTPQSKAKSFFVKNFQKKYSAFILTAFLGCGLLFILPAAWFINSNFQLLSQLALDTSPKLLGHLEREIQWLNIYLILTLSGLVISCLVLSQKLTYHLIEPAQKIERYLRELQDGHYHISETESLADHDLKDLAETARTFHQKLKADSQNHRFHLEKITPDVHSREALYSLQILKDYYNQRTPAEEPRTAPAARSNEFDSQRRVS